MISFHRMLEKLEASMKEAFHWSTNRDGMGNRVNQINVLIHG